MVKILLILLTLALSIHARGPPLFDYPYNVPFNYSCVRKGVPYHTTGHLWYDPTTSRERIDLHNGRHEFFCGSIMPGVDSNCTSITVSSKRWYIIHNRDYCCLCCDKSTGLAAEGDYEGMSLIDEVYYDIWHHTGFTSQDYLYVTRDENQFPRRLSESGNPIFDYNLGEFHKGKMPEDIFQLPSYCNANKPRKCPLKSMCGLIRTFLH